MHAGNVIYMHDESSALWMSDLDKFHPSIKPPKISRALNAVIRWLLQTVLCRMDFVTYEVWMSRDQYECVVQ